MMRYIQIYDQADFCMQEFIYQFKTNIEKLNKM